MGHTKSRGFISKPVGTQLSFFLFKEPNTSEFEIKCYAIFPRSQGTHKKTFKTL